MPVGVQGVQAWDRYAYVNNSPVKYVDENGHWIIAPAVLVGAVVGAAIGYGAQVYSNYQNGYSGSEAWTQNIDYKPIVGGALVGAGAVLMAPAAVAMTGEVLAGTGALFGSTTLFTTGLNVSNASVTLEGLIVGANKNLPILEIDPKRMPNIASNIKDAQRGGAPSVLTRTTDQARIQTNRDAACAEFCGTGSPDEYPFASTYEGGVGAFVRGVPFTEQKIQGGVINHFYRGNNIGDGDKFRVISR